MTTELAQGFIQALDSGVLDGDLFALQAAVVRRQRATNAQTAAFSPIFGNSNGGFSPGDRVITSERINPQYLRARPGVLVRFKQKRWAFKPDDPSVWGRFLNPTDGTTGLLPSQFKRET